MIIVNILRNADQTIEGFRVKGHANYAERGRDIVCAGVSAVTVGTVNAIEKLTGIEMDSEMEHGFLSAVLPESAAGSSKEQAQLLLSSLVVMLESIELSYGKYLKIKDIIN
ncbi:ribosomal-processing cysteine protease Prp [Paenibacillus sp. CAA11]|uniref:ribosomal-processing cysteine protease Prp n=1 Tax=Paenibacillus sp. CAA11 TaxID=1532905 RepID=UPI000D343CA0|nr:ribosomal-processing cysteine protease Prp [Paenibacillus sp. CAA11]AWB45717.1 ribosomal-processing cysteine protease Prp [Paenibacillus sp. CAA11]